MFRATHAPLVLAALIFLTATAALAADVTNVAVGASSSKSVNSVTIQGENIYVDGELQKEKYRPGTDVIVRDGRVQVVPHDSKADDRKAADKAAAKEARAREKTDLKAQIKVEKEAIKREAAQGLDKGATKVETGAVVNKGGTVRIGNKVYRDSTPGTDKDIPPDARKALEDAKKLSQ